MGQECSCHCGDGKSEMNYQEVSFYNFFILTVNEHDAIQLTYGRRIGGYEQQKWQQELHYVR